VGPVSFSAQDEFVPIDNNRRFIRKNVEPILKSLNTFLVENVLTMLNLGTGLGVTKESILSGEEF